MKSRSSPKSKEHARSHGKDAYNEIVRIVHSYHKETKLPLAGHSIRHGHLVLERDWVYTKKCPIAVMRIPEHPAYPVHRHDFHEITVILHGVGTNIVDGKPFAVGTGDVFVLQGSHEHSIEKPESLEVLNICYDPGLLGIHAREFPDSPGFQALFQIEPSLRRKGFFNKHLRLNSKQLAKIETLATEMDAEIQQAQPGYIAVARSQLLEIIALLSRWYSNVDQKDLTDTRRIAKALLWIEQNPEGNLTIPDLCRMCGLSRRQFFRVFKACTDQTPAEYLLNLRLRKAEELLRDPTMNITEVAFACGFNDSNHFSRSFKTFSGVSPREYKKTREVSGGYRPSRTKPPE